MAPGVQQLAGACRPGGGAAGPPRNGGSGGSWKASGDSRAGQEGHFTYNTKKKKKKAKPRASESHLSSSRWGKLTSAHLTLEAGPVGVSRFKFENLRQPV